MVRGRRRTGTLYTRVRGLDGISDIAFISDRRKLRDVGSSVLRNRRRCFRFLRGRRCNGPVSYTTGIAVGSVSGFSRAVGRVRGLSNISRVRSRDSLTSAVGTVGGNMNVTNF